MNTTSDHLFARFIRPLGRGRRARRDLSREEAREAFSAILDRSVRPEQLGAFLMLLRIKEETPEEVAGMASAVRERLSPPPALPRQAVDWPSYAGKRRRAPWFVLAQLLLAQNGHPVFCHGRDGGDPQRCYTATVYRALGLPIARDFNEAVAHLERDGLCYMELRLIDPVLEELFALRPLLGLRSPVNTVARMLNPFGLPSLQGIFHPGFAAIHQRAGALLGDRLAVFRGEGGEGEIRPDTETTLFAHRDNSLQEAPWPALLQQRSVRPASWDLHELCELWRGIRQDEYGVAAVLSTAAVALWISDGVLSLEEALQRVQTWWAARDTKTLPCRPH